MTIRCPAIGAALSILAAAVLVSPRAAARERRGPERLATPPAGVSVRVSVERSEYRIGERIPVVVEFGAGDTAFRMGTRPSRIGRFGPVAFRVDGPEGGARDLGVYEALLYANEGPGGGGGDRQAEVRVAFDLNAWYRFDRPGLYHFDAEATLVSAFPEGGAIVVPAGSFQVRLRPRDPDVEAKVLAEAEEKLAAEDPMLECEGQRLLAWLGSARAVERLLGQLQGPCSTVASLGIVSARDRGHVRRVLEAGLADPAVPVTPTYLHAMALVMQGPDLFTLDLRDTDFETLRAPFVAFGREVTEIENGLHDRLEAVLPGKTGPARGVAVRTLLDRQGRPVSAEVCRAAALAWPDMAFEQRRRVLASDRMSCPELDDIAGSIVSGFDDEAAKGSTELYLTALKRLGADNPALLRDLVLDDLLRPRPVLDADVIVRNLPEALPAEVEDAVVDHLLSGGDAGKLAAVLARVGSARHLDRVAAFYTAKEGRWACGIQSDLLRYWLRHDREAALQAVKRAAGLREKTRCYRSVPYVLRDDWGPDAEAVTVSFLRDDDPDVVVHAIRVLERAGSEAVVDPLLALLASLDEVEEYRLDRPPARDPSGSTFSLPFVRYELLALFLDKGCWPLTDDQRRVLSERLRNDRERERFRDGPHYGCSRPDR